MEFGPYGTLFDLMLARQSKKKILTENEILKLVKQINNSLVYMHDVNYINCDLKIENLLFFDFDCVKMCDFGSVNQIDIDFSNLASSEYDKYMNIFEKQTTFMYRPPEMCDP